MKTKFDKLTKAGKRIAIAKDVLAQLRARKLQAKLGAWAVPAHTNINELPNDTDLAKLFESKQCMVCGVGALFVAAVEKCGNYHISELGPNPYRIEGDRVFDYLADRKKLFSNSQLRMIEIAFERGSGAMLPETKRERDARDFFPDEYVPAETRMRKIMQNIIDNGGTFNP